MKLTCEFDLKTFNTGLFRIASTVPGAALSGMNDAMAEFKDDCLTKPPMCPIEEGDLREAHEISVRRVGNAIEGKLTVDLPYAASIHEGISRWGTPYHYKTSGTGAKWVQSKQIRYRASYIRRMRIGIMRAFKRWFK